MAAPAFAASGDGEGDPAEGRVKFNTCMGCHGIDSYSNAYPRFKVPMLGGQHADYIIAALEAYASGEREHSTMHAQAASMSEQDYKDIAAFLAQPQP
ncbi:MAG TPA: c-type cytochrome [Salinisphaeraceae bacterium]|nr:c-type cytochrome [Salinisphaeraceae bacterium]